MTDHIRMRVAEIRKSARLPWTGNGTWLRRELKWLCDELIRALDESKAARTVAAIYVDHRADAGFVRCIACDSKSAHEDDCPVAAYERTQGGG